MMFLTENCAPRPLPISDVVIPRTSPTTYPLPATVIWGFPLTALLETVTIPVAPDPDPVIE